MSEDINIYVNKNIFIKVLNLLYHIIFLILN
jgi:hypothetical protein